MANHKLELGNVTHQMNLPGGGVLTIFCDFLSICYLHMPKEEGGLVQMKKRLPQVQAYVESKYKSGKNQIQKLDRSWAKYLIFEES